MINIYGNCPQCGASWDGGEIPENIREYYGPPYKWSRVMAIEYSERYDGVWEYECPDCKAVFPSEVQKLWQHQTKKGIK